MLRVDVRQGLDTRRVAALWRLQYGLGGCPSRGFFQPPEGVILSSLKRLGPSPRGIAHFVAAALPNISIRALKLGDMTTLTGVARGLLAGFKHA